MTPVSGSVFGFSVAVPLRQSEQTTTRFFGASTGSAVQIPFGTSASNATLGVQLGLPGGAQASISLQNSTPSFGSGPFAATPSQEPAVFAFYNFPQASNGFSFRGFGLAAPNAVAPALAAAQAAPVNSNPVTSPLINAFSAQGPFWYGSYTPATTGSSLSLTIPFRLAKIPVSVRLGEQSISDVQSTSLANQILGPAFASSAGLQYNAVSGGVSLALPVLSRRATVNLDGLYQTLQQGNQTPFNLAPYASQADAGMGVPGAVIYTPVASGVQQYVGAASVAVPVTSRLTVNGSFSEQVSGNVALDALTQTLTQHMTGYGGGVAYNFPKSNSSIEFFSNRGVYTDDNLPNYNVTQSSQNLYFSVKF
jgi:hypothetical protein